MIHLGVDHERFRPGEETREELLVYPARPWPHKNHARLFEAFDVLRGATDRPALVLPGYEGSAPEGVGCSGT